MRRSQASGSGAIISADGYIVTNHHVAGNATRMICSLSSGEEIEATADRHRPAGRHRRAQAQAGDAQAGAAPLAVAAWGDSDKAKVGDVVLAMGCPMAVSQSVTKGIVSNTQMMMPRYLQGMFRLDGEDVGQIVRWIGHDAVIFGGNSGGPLVNLKAKSSASTKSAWAPSAAPSPATSPNDVAEEIILSGHVTRSWTGMEFQPRLKGDKNEHGVLGRRRHPRFARRQGRACAPAICCWPLRGTAGRRGNSRTNAALQSTGYEPARRPAGRNHLSPRRPDADRHG